MNKKIIHIFSIVIVLLMYSQVVQSQVLTNNAGLIYLAPGAEMQVNGALSNNGDFVSSGTLTVTGDLVNDDSLNSSGTINLLGNWVNNAVFYDVSGSVILGGNQQNISGDTITRFHDLTLQGAGIKDVLINTELTGILSLGDREMNLHDFNFTVQNGDNLAITRTTGFVSNGLNGRLIRKMDTGNLYLYPLGSSIGTVRYRPISIWKGSNDPAIFSAGFINHNADIDGYDRNSHSNNLCNLYDEYYYQVFSDSGTKWADINFYFDSLTESNYTTIANWGLEQASQWGMPDSVSLEYGTPLSYIMTHYVNFDLWSSTFVLAKPNINVGYPSFITQNCANELCCVSDENFSYLWSNADSSSCTSISMPGIYSVTVTDGFCTAIESINVTSFNYLIANAGNDTTICKGESLQLHADDCGYCGYHWSSSGSMSNTEIANPIVVPMETTVYHLEITNGYCYEYDEIIVFVRPPPLIDAGSDTIVTPNSPYIINAVTPANCTYIWSPSEGLSSTVVLNPTANVSQTTIYHLEVTDDLGCVSSDDVTLQVLPATEIIFYNTFSPNADGENDLWIIENIQFFSNNYLRIYNRNGHIVYEKKGYANEWDGKYYGNDLPAATYYYVLEVDGFDPFKGDITIIR